MEIMVSTHMAYAEGRRCCRPHSPIGRSPSAFEGYRAAYSSSMTAT